MPCGSHVLQNNFFNLPRASFRPITTTMQHLSNNSVTAQRNILVTYLQIVSSSSYLAQGNRSIVTLLRFVVNFALVPLNLSARWRSTNDKQEATDTRHRSSFRVSFCLRLRGVSYVTITWSTTSTAGTKSPCIYLFIFEWQSPPRQRSSRPVVDRTDRKSDVKLYSDVHLGCPGRPSQQPTSSGSGTFHCTQPVSKLCRS